MSTRVVAFLLVAASAVSCGGGAGGKVLNETMQYDSKTKKWTPLLEYKAPDVDEISGVDSDEPDEGSAKKPQPNGGK